MHYCGCTAARSLKELLSLQPPGGSDGETAARAGLAIAFSLELRPRLDRQWLRLLGNRSLHTPLPLTLYTSQPLLDLPSTFESARLDSWCDRRLAQVGWAAAPVAAAGRGREAQPASQHLVGSGSGPRAHSRHSAAWADPVSATCTLGGSLQQQQPHIYTSTQSRRLHTPSAPDGALHDISSLHDSPAGREPLRPLPLLFLPFPASVPQASSHAGCLPPHMGPHPLLSIPTFLLSAITPSMT